LAHANAFGGKPVGTDKTTRAVRFTANRIRYVFALPQTFRDSLSELNPAAGNAAKRQVYQVAPGERQ
jgi:hypothetical protein